MKYLLIRHGKTDANRLTRAAYGKKGAPINAQGIERATELKNKLLGRGIDLTKVVAATSELLRTQQTAEAAGITKYVTYRLLNEVKTSDPQITNDLIKRRVLPKEAVAAARKLLKNPPKEKIWVTHGLLIAAILSELHITGQADFVPDFCSIIEIEIT